MPSLFTVRWPFFARLQAVSLFPLSLLLASEIARVQNYVDDRLVPVLAPFGATLGIPKPAIVWGAMAMVVVVPYFAVLLVADRFLTIRKGYAFLSLAATAAWTVAAMHWSDQLASLLPETILQRLNWLPFKQEAALAVGGLALLLHLWPLCVGLMDQGQVADRLLDARNRSTRGRSDDEKRHLQDVYYRQTADFRGWRQTDQYEGLAVGPRENSAFKVVSAITWAGVIAAGAFAWYHWDNLAAVQHDTAPPEGRAGTPMAHHVVPPGVPATTVGMPLAPVGVPLAPAGMPITPLTTAHDVHAIPTTAALPAVQRPGEVPTGLTGPNVYTGPNEAVAERGPDGSFTFDAVVNGSHVTMMFDTGATTVALRGEDAERLGINMAKLHYSAKVKTANGIADVAPVVIDTLEIGSITQRHVSGFVAKTGTLQENLLGQTFLARLAKYNVEDNRLVLTGK
jgi:clan AA aspartic protease (TIGR02281 family)